MGFFSWKTADTKKSIWNIYSGRKVRTTYLLQPGGKEPIEEQAYEGYGDFGGVDAFVWLARNNIPEENLAGKSEDEIRSAGIMLESGYYVYTVDGTKHQIFHRGCDIIDPEIKNHPYTYEQPLEYFGGKTANELVAEGLLVRVEFDIKFPLKFSFSKTAVYEDLPASEDCPNQGYF